ncbi:MAG: DUF6754 domain-containing protein, partial [Vulcanimicrobiota bacterium]
KGGKTLWQTKIKDYTRVTPVFTDEDTLYFGAELPFRTIKQSAMYAINKADGSLKWTSSLGVGTVKDIHRTQSGDFLAITQSEITENEKILRKVKITSIKKEDGSEKWQQELEGDFAATPAIRVEPGGTGEYLYFLNRHMMGRETIHDFYSLSMTEGEETWKYPMTMEEVVYGEPVFYKDKVLLFTTSGKIVCLSRVTTETDEILQWVQDAEGLFLQAPIVKGENIYTVVTNTDAEGNITSKIAAYSLENCEKLWEHPIPHMVEVPVTVGDDYIIYNYQTSEDKPIEGEKSKTRPVFNLKLVKLNLENAEIQWEKDIPGKLDAPVTVQQDFVFAPVVYKMVPEGRKDEVTEHALKAMELETGSERWGFTGSSLITTELEIIGETVVFGTKNGYLYTIGKDDGKLVHKFFAGLDNAIDTAIIRYDNKVAFGTQDMKYFILNDQGKALYSFTAKPIFAIHKLAIFVGTVILIGALSWYIYQARSGQEMFIRKIAGLNAIDEAVGRSTEMGRPVLYITGLADVEEIQTLASLSILGHIAQKTAEYDTPLVVPCCRSVVMSTAQEVVKEAYLKAGRPDTFKRENIHYLTDDQFGYVAGVDGIMVREKPAANFYMGKFYAESLILAETGHSTGAIQIAGTAEASQLPFFVAACDYTLIGEELFAASAYLSKDPMQIGSLKGQDIAKAIILFVIIIGSLLTTFGIDWVKYLFATQ